MKKIIIQGPTRPGVQPSQVTLTSGQSATIGVCQCNQCPFDLRVLASGAPPLSWRITAGETFWLLSNLSDRHPVTVQNMDDWYQYVIVDPERLDVPVPFELAHIDLTASSSGPKVSVFGHEPRYIRASPRPCSVCQQVAARRPLLDQRSTYFAVLGELCVERLRGEMDAVLPTSAEMARRLSNRGHPISAGAVDAHIKYVAEKLGLPKGVDRATLVAVIIRSGLLHQPA